MADEKPLEAKPAETPAPAPAPQPAAAAAPAKAAADSKKSSSSTLIIVIVIVVVVLGVGGYLVSRWIAHRAADAVTGGILSAATGGKVSVDSSNNTVTLKDNEGNSLQTGTATWPATMPTDVPKYSGGSIVASSTYTQGSGKGWTVSIDKTSTTDYNAFKAKLEAAGWVSESSANYGVLIDSYTKGDERASLTFDSSSNGTVITVTNGN